METIELLREIEKLSPSEKLLIIEKTVHSLRLNELNSLSVAAEVLRDEYKTNRELIIFSSLDIEDFYEPR